MRTSRKLRVVSDCPQPAPPAAKPIVYGAAPWSRLPHNPTADEITIRVRAQSILSKGGKRAELPDIETARRVIAETDGAAADAAHRHSPAGDHPCPARGGVSAPRIHSSPCRCGDDAQRHYALIARDLTHQGRESELTDDMRQAYDYEFGGVPEPGPIQIPEF